MKTLTSKLAGLAGCWHRMHRTDDPVGHVGSHHVEVDQSYLVELEDRSLALVGHIEVGRTGDLVRRCSEAARIVEIDRTVLEDSHPGLGCNRSCRKAQTLREMRSKLLGFDRQRVLDWNLNLVDVDDGNKARRERTGLVQWDVKDLLRTKKWSDLILYVITAYCALRLFVATPPFDDKALTSLGLTLQAHYTATRRRRRSSARLQAVHKAEPRQREEGTHHLSSSAPQLSAAIVFEVHTLEA